MDNVCLKFDLMSVIVSHGLRIDNRQAEAMATQEARAVVQDFTVLHRTHVRF